MLSKSIKDIENFPAYQETLTSKVLSANRKEGKFLTAFIFIYF
jgi:hypothetical protein